MADAARDATAPEEERRRIRRLLAGASLELSSRDTAEIDACRDLLEPGTSVYISALPGQPLEAGIALAVHLRRCGLNPVPHLAARRIPSRDALDGFLARAAGEAGVNCVLVVAGDAEHAAGPFESSRALIETGLLQRHGITRVGVAGHPEGHAKMTAPELLAAIDAKKSAAAAAGLDAQVVTQFCFEIAPLLSWLNGDGPRGLPVRVGLAGPASLARLLRFAVMCGVGNSIRALKARPQVFARLVSDVGPETMVGELARREHAAVAGLHFFCFGGLVKTARWLRAARDGRFELTPETGFRVESA